MWSKINVFEDSKEHVKKYIFEKKDIAVESVLYKYPTYEERTVLCISTEISKLGKKRSRDQLRAYWRLIRVVKNFMNEQGNLFSDEVVSDWVKIQANHYTEINGQKVAKSIADKSDCTMEQMRQIIEFILAFGIEYNIQDCYIRDDELEELLKFYQK